MPAPSKKLQGAARVARDAAATSTQHLRVLHHIACEDDPILAILVLDMIDRASRIEHRLVEVVKLQEEMRRR